MSFTRADDLFGAWRLHSAVDVFDDGERRDEFGFQPRGLSVLPPRRHRVSDTRGFEHGHRSGR